MNENKKKAAEKCEKCGGKSMLVAFVALGFALVGIMGVLSLKNFISSKQYATRKYVEEYVEQALGDVKKKTDGGDQKHLDCTDAANAENEACKWANDNSYGFPEE